MVFSGYSNFLHCVQLSSYHLSPNMAEKVTKNQNFKFHSHLAGVVSCWSSTPSALGSPGYGALGGVAVPSIGVGAKRLLDRLRMLAVAFLMALKWIICCLKYMMKGYCEYITKHSTNFNKISLSLIVTNKEHSFFRNPKHLHIRA